MEQILISLQSAHITVQESALKKLKVLVTSNPNPCKALEELLRLLEKDNVRITAHVSLILLDLAKQSISPDEIASNCINNFAKYSASKYLIINLLFRLTLHGSQSSSDVPSRNFLVCLMEKHTSAIASVLLQLQTGCFKEEKSVEIWEIVARYCLDTRQCVIEVVHTLLTCINTSPESASPLNDLLVRLIATQKPQIDSLYQRMIIEQVKGIPASILVSRIAELWSTWQYFDTLSINVLTKILLNSTLIDMLAFCLVGFCILLDVPTEFNSEILLEAIVPIMNKLQETHQGLYLRMASAAKLPLLAVMTVESRNTSSIQRVLSGFNDIARDDCIAV